MSFLTFWLFEWSSCNHVNSGRELILHGQSYLYLISNSMDTQVWNNYQKNKNFDLEFCKKNLALRAFEGIQNCMPSEEAKIVLKTLPGLRRNVEVTTANMDQVYHNRHYKFPWTLKGRVFWDILLSKQRRKRQNWWSLRRLGHVSTAI